MNNTFQTNPAGRLQVGLLFAGILFAFPETGQPEPSIPVLKQQFYCGNKLVISSALANISCADLGINVVFETLNTVLGTSYELTAPVTSVLLSYIAQKADFGTVYAHLHLAVGFRTSLP